MKLQGFRVLSEDEISRIHEASIRLLEHTGVTVVDGKALDILTQGGASVDRSLHRARLCRSLVEDAIASLPSSFKVYDRDGSLRLEVGGDQLHFVAGADANYVYDHETQTRRPATKQDVADFAHLADALPSIHIVAPQVTPQDVPGWSAMAHAFEAVVNNTTKPIYITPGGGPISRAILEMAQQVAGEANLRERPFVVGYAAPTSPLTWQPDATEALVEWVSRGLPIALGPCPLMGMSSPITVAGAVAVANAEQLSGIVLAHLVSDGTPVMYGAEPLATDMRQGLPSHGDPNSALGRLACAQMAQFYRLPGIVSGPNTDAHCLDAQNAWEKLLTALTLLDTGINMMVNAGTLASVATASHAQLVLDDEILGACLQVQKGVEVSEETLALELIEGAGPGGSFLAEMHTVKHWRKDYRIPSIANRSSYHAWNQAGNRDVTSIASERSRKILAEHHPPALSIEVQEALRNTCEAFERRHLADAGAGARD